MASNAENATPFGKTALLLHMIQQSQLDEAIRAQLTTHRGQPLGDIMIEKKILTPQQVQIVLSRQSAKALVCPQCHKRYQILLYQSSRTYRCRKCPGEVALVGETIALHASQRSSGNIDLMGLTQELEIVKDKVSTDGIDFVPETKKISTRQVLENAGMEAFIVDYTKRPQARQKANYLGWIITILFFSAIGFGSAYLFAIFSNAKTDEPSRRPTTIEPTEAQIALEYQKIQTQPVLLDNRESIKAKLELWRNFEQKYPKSSHLGKVSEEIQGLEIALVKLQQRGQILQELQSAQVYLDQAQFALVETKLQQISAMAASLGMEGEIQKFADTLQKAAEKKFTSTLATAQKLGEQKKYEQAIALIQAEQIQQLKNIQELISNQIQEYQAFHQELTWIQAWPSALAKVYPKLMTRDYAASQAILNQELGTLATENKWLVSSLQDIAEMEAMWKQLHITLQKLEKSRVSWQTADGKQVSGILDKWTPQEENLYIKTSTGYKNIRLAQLASAEIAKLLKLEANAAQTHIFIMLLVPWKTAPALKFAIDRLAKDSLEYKKTFLYLAADFKVALASNDVNRIKANISYLGQYPSPFFKEIVGPELSNWLWQTAQNPKYTKKQQQFFVEILLKHFPSTPAAQEAKKRASK